MANNLLNSSGSGDSLNVVRYQKFPYNVSAGDCRRCENTIVQVESVYNEVAKAHQHIENKRASLFDSKSNFRVKSYHTYELQFLDAYLQSLCKWKNELSAILNKIKHTHQQLKTKFRPDSVEKAEEGRKKRQDVKTEKRRVIRLAQRHMISANKISQLLTNTNIVKMKNNKAQLVQPLTKNDTDKLRKIRLFPKLHLTGWELLIKLNAFPDEDMAQSVLSVLKERQRQRSKKSKAVGEQGTNQKQSHTLLGWLAKGKEDNAGDMEEESESESSSDIDILPHDFDDLSDD